MEKALKKYSGGKGKYRRRHVSGIAAFDLREALDNLDEITGKKINDEILDEDILQFLHRQVIPIRFHRLTLLAVLSASSTYNLKLTRV